VGLCKNMTELDPSRANRLQPRPAATRSDDYVK
jgi:hypothetical protein